jgi:hypothetical protein
MTRGLAKLGVPPEAGFARDIAFLEGAADREQAADIVSVVECRCRLSADWIGPAPLECPRYWVESVPSGDGHA